MVEMILLGIAGVFVCVFVVLFYLMIKESNKLCDYIQESAKKWPRIK